MKKFFLATILGIALASLAACGSSESTLDKLKDDGKVTVGFANEKPYAYEENGKLKGAAVDIATAVFKELGIDKVDGKLSDFSQLVSGLNAGQFDVITAGMAITPERCENVAFGEPEMQYGEGFIVQKREPEKSEKLSGCSQK
ncbi:transporter substrate-binding domain-containing protein [Virgibacillus halophilus]|uniref:Transporter substrate-binding domain-containing protein n=1 Tax=Tigheibacillus halophilus TaxID=361280 RepID=A0ABU5C9T0_9BACI|nr:transporter substrate-binding domain-containing protein [Virgibacillus halophilus]